MPAVCKYSDHFFSPLADTLHSPNLEHKNLIHQFMSNKSSSSSSNNHFHYHLYQYQTHNCCLNLFDQSKNSSTVTTAASNENFFTQSISNLCDFTPSRNTQNTPNDDENSKAAVSSKFENPSGLTSSGSEFPSTIFNNQSSKVNFSPSLGGETPSSKSQTAEKIIDIEFTNDNYRQPEADDDDCSCTKKYLPYKVNERNVWQVYETSDCKYIQSKYEVDEVFQPPSSDGTKTSFDYNPLLHSRSNFSNKTVTHTISQAQASDQSESVNSSTPCNLNSTSNSLYTPSFNIKSETIEDCNCVINKETEDDDESKADDDDDDDVVSVISKQPPSSKDSFQPNSKLLNRPKATNNISREQVKPIEKEVQNEITKNGVKVSSMKASKLVRLPSPVPKRRTTPKSDSETDSDFSSEESSIKEKTSKKISPKDQTRQQSSLVRQESKNVVIPNIHQGELTLNWRIFELIATLFQAGRSL